MTKEEFKELLRENLRIEIETQRTPDSYYESANTKTCITVYFDDEVICTAEDTVFD